MFCENLDRFGPSKLALVSCPHKENSQQFVNSFLGLWKSLYSKRIIMSELSVGFFKTLYLVYVRKENSCCVVVIWTMSTKTLNSPKKSK